MSRGIRLAVVGATGAVGQETLKILQERDFPISELICLADPREEGTIIEYKGEAHTVRAASPQQFKEADVALFAVGTEVSQHLAPLAVESGCTVIDNSYAFRLVDEVPLVVPEVNPQDIAWHKGIIANPNCSTIIMVVALNPIHQQPTDQSGGIHIPSCLWGGIAGLGEWKNIPGHTLTDSRWFRKYSNIPLPSILFLISTVLLRGLYS